MGDEDSAEAEAALQALDRCINLCCVWCRDSLLQLL